MNVAQLAPPDTPAVRAAQEVLEAYSSPALVNHCHRSYLWATAYGRLNGIEHDPELLWVAAMLHDLGLVPAFDNHTAPFEEAGGDVAWVFGAGAGWPEALRTRAKEVIVRHMGEAPDPAADAEGHLLNLGTGLDISGWQPDEWPADLRAEVLDLHPRLGLPEEFLGAFQDQADRKPGCAAAAAVAGGVAGRILANPLDRPS